MPEHNKVKTQNSLKWFCLFHSSQSSLITWLFVERPQVVGVTSDQDVCEHSEVTLSCHATGKPEPNITWTRVSENGTDSEALQSKDGYLVMANISWNSNGTYRCTAFNGVGEPVNQTVKVIVRCKLSRLCNVSFKLIKFFYFTSVLNILFLWGLFSTFWCIFNRFRVQRSTGMHNICILLPAKRTKKKYLRIT